MLGKNYKDGTHPAWLVVDVGDNVNVSPQECGPQENTDSAREQP